MNQFKAFKNNSKMVNPAIRTCEIINADGTKCGKKPVAILASNQEETITNKSVALCAEHADIDLNITFENKH